MSGRVITWRLVAAMALSSAVAFGASREVRESLFSETDQTMRLAQAEHADVLAPKSFSEAMKRYEEADRNFEKGKDLADIREDLARANEYLAQAIEATKLANVTLATAIRARDDAKKVSSVEYSAENWTRAEQKFSQAAAKLEDGDVKSASKTGGEAETLYRTAELEAIKNNLFAEARKTLARAKKLDAHKYAPVTLARSTELLNQAELTLNEDRYDTDKVRDLARQSRYEAQHAIYLSDLASSVKEKKMTLETVLLRAEDPLQRIADQADLVARFDQGYEPTTTAILEYVSGRQTEVQSLGQKLVDEERRTTDLSNQVLQLERELGGVSEAQLALRDRMKAQEEFQRLFDSVGSAYTYEEARVLRDGDTCIIRLVGMAFDPGKAEIRPDRFSLLTKLRTSIESFPGSEIRVEGHTDSYGSDESNLKLSQDRAEAVRQYLIANSRVDAYRITATGYGETQPIANNESPAGRAKNRRIDVMIVPAMDE